MTVMELSRTTIAAKIEAADRRAFWAMLQTFPTSDLVWVVDRAMTVAYSTNPPQPTRLAAYRAALSTLNRRTRATT